MGKYDAQNRYAKKCNRVEVKFSPNSQTYEALVKYTSDQGIPVASYIKELIQQDLFKKYYLEKES